MINQFLKQRKIINKKSVNIFILNILLFSMKIHSFALSFDNFKLQVE